VKNLLRQHRARPATRRRHDRQFEPAVCESGAARGFLPPRGPGRSAARQFRRFLLEVTQAVPILLVEGEPQSDPDQSDSRYFLAALGYSEDAKEALPSASIFRPKLINYERLSAEALSSYQCIVLADIPRLPADLVQKLVRYVNSGGGLWIALGEQTDVAAFNQAFFEASAGLSALPLRQPVGDADDREKFIGLTPPSPDHPATALLADTHRLDIDRVRIYRRHQFDAETGSFRHGVAAGGGWRARGGGKGTWAGAA